MVSIGTSLGAGTGVNCSVAGVVGRVGALAVALGAGSVIASPPVTFADMTGSAGSSGCLARRDSNRALTPESHASRSSSNSELR